MKDFLSIKDAEKLADEQPEGVQVSVRGWVHRERGSSKVKFIVLRDSTTTLQCVVKPDTVGEEKFKIATGVQIEASMKLFGTIKKDERAPTGYELQVTDLAMVGHSDKFPITKDQSTEFLLDKRHLWIRSRKMTAIMKIRSTIFWAIHQFFRNKKYYEMAPPIFTPSSCEGGSTLFEVKYFDDTVYLTQSWQLYAEAVIFSLENIYCISPCFRSEKSKTSRHLAEFWMAETEVAWMTLPEITELAKELVAHIVQTVLQENKTELKTLDRNLEALEKIKLPFETITYTEALQLLKEKKGLDIQWGKDLRTIEEDKLMELFDKPIVVIEYPKETMAFYKPEKKLRPGEEGKAPGPVALCFDMLAPEGYGEIIGGSERDTDLDALLAALKKEGEDLENYEWYLDLRRHGSVPHSGFGLGVERVVAWMCGLDNIKDAIPFPRTMLRKHP